MTLLRGVFVCIACACAIDAAEIVPDSLKSTSNYIEALSSTSEEDVISIGESGTMLRYDTLDAMIELSTDPT